MAAAAASSKPAAAAVADPPFPLLEEDKEGQYEQKQKQEEKELPHGGELELPVVDLEAPGDALVAASRRLGVFRIGNHGVPGELSARLFALARELLGQTPFQEKQAQPGYFWGTPALALRVKDVNWVEGFHFALGQKGPAVTDAAAVDPQQRFSEFRDVAREYGEHMSRVARKLFDAMALSLGLDADQTATYIAERDGALRVYRYPPCPGASHLGMEPHTDSTVLSIINQDLVGGLQVVHDGAWRDVVQPAAAEGGEGTMLVNLGDIAQAVSGDAYHSVRHRVVASRDRERVSLCFFANPPLDAVLTCPGGGSRYRPFTYGEFREQVQADIKAFGSKVGGLKPFIRN